MGKYLQDSIFGEARSLDATQQSSDEIHDAYNSSLLGHAHQGRKADRASHEGRGSHDGSQRTTSNTTDTMS